MLMVARNAGGSPWDPATRPLSPADHIGAKALTRSGMGTEDGARRPYDLSRAASPSSFA